MTASEYLAALVGTYSVNPFNVQMDGINSVQLVKNNPRRWGLMFATFTSASMAVWLSEFVNLNLGIPIGIQDQNLNLNAHDNPSLVQAEWWGFSSVPGFLNVIEVLVN